MITLNKNELRDKIYACWLGKNIGGTLGTPFEAKQEVLDVKGFNSEPGCPLPNDDLDLQLVWLLAVIRGEKITEQLLGEYWLEYVPPYWNEYGICKTNMQRGLMPPLCGTYDNAKWKHSNGAWIRTEVWACLYPALVDEALKYSFTDAVVDHGNKGEGTYATMFVSAMESAAFVVSDIRKLIEIGLSKLPKGCRFASYIKTVIDMYDNGNTWLEARNKVTDMALADPELGWFQAPANVSYVVIGLLWGEGDFKKSVLTAINCGDDTDCTGATVGALLGILGGTAAIPADWREYIGDKLETIAINRGAMSFIPKTCTQLTDTIMDTHQKILVDKPISICDTETSADDADIEAYMNNKFAAEIDAHSEYSFRHDSVLASYWIDYDREPVIFANGDFGLKISIKNKFDSHKQFSVRFLLPDGWSVTGKKNMLAQPYWLEQVFGEYVIHADDNVSAENRIVLEITVAGHYETTLIPLVLLG